MNLFLLYIFLSFSAFVTEKERRLLFFSPSFSLSFSSLCRRVRSLNANVLTAAPIVVAWKTWFTELYLRIPFLPSLFLIHVFWKRFKFFETIWTDRDLEIIVKLRLSSASLTSYTIYAYLYKSILKEITSQLNVILNSFLQDWPWKKQNKILFERCVSDSEDWIKS